MDGRTIGHYEVIEKLAQGGGGNCSTGPRDLRLDLVTSRSRPCLPEMTFRPGAAPALQCRKARAASALNHLNIITIYEIAEWEEVGLHRDRGSSSRSLDAARA